MWWLVHTWPVKLSPDKLRQNLQEHRTNSVIDERGEKIDQRQERG